MIFRIWDDPVQYVGLLMQLERNGRPAVRWKCPTCPHWHRATIVAAHPEKMAFSLLPVYSDDPTFE